MIVYNIEGKYMKRNINEILINKIQENISSNEKLVTYLMNKLSIGRESAYRRIRNQISFTIDEIIKLADEFEFSIDEILGIKNNENYHIETSPNLLKNSLDSFMGGLNSYYNFLLRSRKSNKKDIVMIINRLSPIYVFSHDYIFKFLYYKWMRQFSYLPLTMTYSEVTLPTEVIDIRNKISDLFFQLTNVSYTCIIDQYLYLDILKEIQYYYRRGLISEEDLSLIKNDFLDLMLIIEEMVVKGTKYSYKHESYISMHAIESTCIHVSLDEEVLVSFTPCSLFPMWTTHEELCELIKRWIDSLKKHSTFITKSNDYVQSAFFKTQYEYINSYLSSDSKDPIFSFMDEF